MRLTAAAQIYSTKMSGLANKKEESEAAAAPEAAAAAAPEAAAAAEEMEDEDEEDEEEDDEEVANAGESRQGLSKEVSHCDGADLSD